MFEGIKHGAERDLTWTQKRFYDFIGTESIDEADLPGKIWQYGQNVAVPDWDRRLEDLMKREGAKGTDKGVSFLDRLRGK